MGWRNPKIGASSIENDRKSLTWGTDLDFTVVLEILIDRRHDVSGTGLLAIKTNAPSIASAVTHIAVHRKINGNF